MRICSIFIIFLLPINSYAETFIHGSIFCEPDYSLSSSDYQLKTKNEFGDIDYHMTLKSNSYSNREDETKLLLRYSNEISFWDKYYNPSDEKIITENKSFEEKFSKIIEFENYYINENTRKLAASNELCKLRIEDDLAHFTCDVSADERVRNEMFYMTLTCEWN